MQSSAQSIEYSPRVQSRIIKLQDNLKKICLLYGLPLSYCSAFIKYLNSCSYQTKEDEYKVKMFIISDETNLIKKGQSFPQSMAQILTQRQKVLKYLRSDLITARKPKQLNLSDCIEKVQSIRMYSLNIIENLITLAKRFKSAQSNYFYKIIDKINKDVDFLRFSILRKHVEFSSSHDPLFIVPLRKFQNLQTTTDYNRTPVIQLFTVETKYRKRLDIADNFAKKVSNTFEKLPYESQGQFQTQTDRYHLIDTKGNQQIGSNNETIKKSNLPQMHKKVLPISYRLQRQGNQKKMVTSIIRKIVQDYNFKQKSMKQEKHNKQNKKQRFITQANDQQSIINKIYHPKLNTKQTIKESFSIEKKDSKDHQIQKGMKFFQEKRFRQDQADISKNQQSLNSSLYMSKYHQLPKNKFLKSFEKYHQHISKQQSKKPSLESEKEKIKFKRQLSHQQETKIYSSKQHDESIAKGKSKPKVNRFRNNKIICKDINKPLTQELRQTVYKNQQSIVQRNKTFDRQVANHQLQEDEEKAITVSDLIGRNKKLIKKIKGIQNMTSFTPIRKQFFYNSFNQKQSQQHQIHNERFHSPLDKVVELRQHLDYDSEQEDEHQISRGRKQKSRVQLRVNDKYLQEQLKRSKISQIMQKHKQFDANNLTKQFLNQEISGEYDNMPKHYDHSQRFYKNRTLNLPNDNEQQLNERKAQQNSYLYKNDDKIGQYQTKIRFIERNNQEEMHQQEKQFNKEYKEKYQQLDRLQYRKNPIFNIDEDNKFQQTFGTKFLKNQGNSRAIQDIVEGNSQKNQQIIKNKYQQKGENNNRGESSSSKNNQNQEFIARQPHILGTFPSQSQSSGSLGTQFQNLGSFPNQPQSSTTFVNQPQSIFESTVSLNQQNVNQKGLIPSPELSKEPSNRVVSSAQNNSQQFLSNKSNNSKTLLNKPNISKNDSELNQKSKNNLRILEQAKRNSIVNMNLSQNNVSNQNRNSPSPKINKTKNEMNLNNLNIQVKLPASDGRSKVVNNSLNPNLISNSSTNQGLSLSNQRQIQIIQKQSILVLQKCTFISKSLKEQQLLRQLQQSNPYNYESLKAFLCTQYFMQRHIQLANCFFDQQLAFYCIYYPRITENQRQLFIVHIEVIKQEFLKLTKQIISTLLKYFFTNDPTQRIILLKHTTFFDNTLGNCMKLINHYQGQAKCPIKSNMLLQSCYVFTRKQVPCNKSQQFTTILDTTCLFIALQQQIPVDELCYKNINISNEFLKRMNTKIKGNYQRFDTQNELQQYLQEQNLPLIKSNFNKNIFLAHSIWEDCLINARFYVHSKTFFFTIEPPFTYLYENSDAFYLLISTSDPKKYFLFADKLYEEDQHFNILQNFKETVLNKNVKDIFLTNKHNNKIVACPQFKKKVELQINQKSHALIQFQLKWKQYIKGIGFYKNEQNCLYLMSPFLCALVHTDENGTIKYQYSTLIEENDILK